MATSSVYEFRDDSSNYGIRGNFYYDNGKYTYRFGDQDTYTLKIEGYKVQNAGPLRIVLHLSCSGNPYLMYKGYLGNEPNLNDNVKYRASLSLESSSIKVTNSGSIGSDAVITKSDLLKTEYTPCDYLLNYTKLFGLYYIKDINEKKVTICSRNTFFTGETVNIDDKINYNLNMSISPILFDKKYYSLILNTPETRFAKKYKKDYNQEYGQQRISTGYNFSSETQNFYEDNIYQTTIPILDVSSYYRRYYDATGKEVPCFIADNVTYELYKDDDTNTTDLYAVDIIKSIVELNYTPGNDIFPKTCFYGYDGNTKSLEEVSASLLLWNGQKNCKDILGNDVPYYITDDLTEMIQLNDREPCYLYTESETDISNNKIACKRVVLPQYINLLVDYSNNVTASMDIGLPKEVYCGKVSYDENKTIYYKFWKNYYNDQFDINTKKVTCYVKFNKLSQDDLRKFYWFDNAIWILNKVNDYDVNSDNTTLCEFIKVQNTDNYTIGQNI